MCNSRRHRQCPASRESVKHTPGPRRNGLQGVRLHNPDYVKFAPSVGCEGPAFELPCEAAADKRPPSRTSGLQARQGAAHFALLRISVGGYSSSAPPAVGTVASDFRFEARIKGRWYARAQSAGTCNVSASRPSVARWQPQCRAGKSAALGASLGVGPAPPVVCQAEPATPLPAPFLRGTAPPCHHLPAIPPHLVSFPPCARSSLRCGPCSAPRPQSVPGRQDTAVRIRSRLLAQTVPVIPPLSQMLRSCIKSGLSATDCAVPHASRE